MQTKQKKKELDSIASLPVFAEEIRKTGFVLENRVAQILKKKGWTIIGNKHYVDDASSIVREIDLIAYRTTLVGTVAVYTVLIISCKKSEENAWAFLSRPLIEKDPNANWWPLHIWTNDKVLNSFLVKEGSAEAFHKTAQRAGSKNAFAKPKVDVFAFQEMRRSDGTPRDDRAIYQSITTLIKAQAYEISALPERKKRHPSLYQFNLLNVVEGDLLRLMFEGEKITCSHIETEHQLARHIVGKRETFARIRFLHIRRAAEVLSEYADVHLDNCDWVRQSHSTYYRDPFIDTATSEVLIDEFVRRISFELRWRLRVGHNMPDDLQNVAISRKKGSAEIEISFFDLNSEQIAILANDAGVKRAIGKALEEVYRYTGPFSLDEIPF